MKNRLKIWNYLVLLDESTLRKKQAQMVNHRPFPYPIFDLNFVEKEEVGLMRS
jgi:hypothetical protein